MTEERLHDLDTVLTYEEIEELRNICYEHGNSWCPISDFFNDIERTKNMNYNKNQAFKDLWLIVNIILEKGKKLEAFEIIKNKKVQVAYLHSMWDDFETTFNSNDEDVRWLYNEGRETNEQLAQKEYDLLKEAGL